MRGPHAALLHADVVAAAQLVLAEVLVAAVVGERGGEGHEKGREGEEEGGEEVHDVLLGWMRCS